MVTLLSFSAVKFSQKSKRNTKGRNYLTWVKRKDPGNVRKEVTTRWELIKGKLILPLWRSCKQAVKYLKQLRYKIKEREAGGPSLVLLDLQSCRGNWESASPAIGLQPTGPASLVTAQRQDQRKPRDHNRDISGLLDKGLLLSWSKRSWSDTPPHTAGSPQNRVAPPATIYRGGSVRLANQLPGKPSRARPSQPLKG